MRRSLDIGLRLAPTPASAVAAAKGLAAMLDRYPDTPVRLAGLGSDGTRVHITIALSMGSVEDVRHGGPEARAALEVLHAVIDHCAPYDPAFVALPAVDSLEARIAKALSLQASDASTLTDAVRELAAVS